MNKRQRKKKSIKSAAEQLLRAIFGDGPILPGSSDKLIPLRNSINRRYRLRRAMARAIRPKFSNS